MAADLGTGFINVLPNTSLFGPAMVRKVQPVLDAVERSTGLAFSTMEVAGVAAFAGITAASLKFASDFEASMAKVEGLVGLTHTETEQLSQSVLDLAKTVPVAPKELADALYFIESAGLRGQTALDALTASAQAAAAGLGSTKEVADVVTSAMNSYAQSGLTAAQATDILIAAVREGKTDPAVFAKNIGQVLPVAAQLGITFDQVAAAIASSTREGLQASRAATGIRYLLGALIRPSEQSQEALNGVGISLEALDTSLRNRGLLPTLTELAHRFDISTAEGRKLFSTVVGGIRGLSTASILVGQNAKAVQQIFYNVEHSGGSLFRAFSVASGTTAFKVGQLKSQLEVLAITFGQKLLPVAKDVLTALSFLTEHVLGPLVDHAGELLVVFGGYYALGKLAGVFTRLDAAVAGLTGSLVTEAEAASASAEASTADALATTEVADALVELAIAAKAAAEALGLATDATAAEGDAAAAAVAELVALANAEREAALAAEDLAAGETTATVAGKEMGASGAASAGILGKVGGAISAARGPLILLAAGLYAVKGGLDSAFTSAEDLSNQFQITADNAKLLQERSTEQTGLFDISPNLGNLGHALADPMGTLFGRSQKEAAAAYAEVAQEALAAGVSQDTLNKALGQAAPILNANRKSIGPFIDSLKAYISSGYSIQQVADRWGLAIDADTGALLQNNASLKSWQDVQKLASNNLKDTTSQLDDKRYALTADTKATQDNTAAQRDVGSVLDKNSAAYKSLNSQQRAYIDFTKQVSAGLLTVGPLFDLMGTNVTAFKEAADKALHAGTFDKFSQDVLKQASDAIAQFRQTAVQNLSFVDDELGKLGDGRTANDIIAAFTKAGAETKSFSSDLKDIGSTLKGQGKALASYLLQTGDTIDAARLAAANEPTQEKAVRAYNKASGAAQSEADTLTRKLVPVLKDLKDLLEAISGQYVFQLNMGGNGQANLNALETQLKTIDGHTYVYEVNGTIHRSFIDATGGRDGDPNTPIAAGGIIAGASGFVTRGPTYLTGEGRYPTRMGTGAEAVIPLNDVGISKLRKMVGKGDYWDPEAMADAMRSAMSGMSVRITDSNLGLVMDGVLDDRDRFNRRLARTAR